MLKTTPLYQQHQALGAKLVDFAGYDMPIHYGSQIEEHHAVRQNAGVFDVSHMAAVDIKGAEATAFLRYLLANDVAKLKPNKALYTCMLNDNGGIIDDLIVYCFSEISYRLVVNAGTREKDIAWIQKQGAAYDITITPRAELAIIALQGPKAHEKLYEVIPPELKAQVEVLKPFWSTGITDAGWLFARTGYTGEDGFEIILPATEVEGFWSKLMAVGVKACGLGARDTLRLEAGMNLYGTDMDETTTPYESGLAWTVVLDPENREFIGQKALIEQKEQGIQYKFVAIVLDAKGVLRGYQKIKMADDATGEITSGSFSPTLGHSIAFARIETTNCTECEVEIRNKWLPAKVVKAPFVRNGKKVWEVKNEPSTC